MSRPTTDSAAAPLVDRHDLIRVHGARENNLKDVDLEGNLVTHLERVRPVVDAVLERA